MTVQVKSIDDLVKGMLSGQAQPGTPAAAPAPVVPGAQTQVTPTNTVAPAANPNEVNQQPAQSPAQGVASEIFQAVSSKNQENQNVPTEPTPNAEPAKPAAPASSPADDDTSTSDPDGQLATIAADTKPKSDDTGGDTGSTTDDTSSSSSTTDDADPFAGSDAGGDAAAGSSEAGDESSPFDDNSGGEGTGDDSTEPSSTEAGESDGKGKSNDTDQSNGSSDESGSTGSTEEDGSKEDDAAKNVNEDESGQEGSSKEDGGQEGEEVEKEKSTDEIAADIKEERDTDASSGQKNREMIEEAVSISKRLVEIAETVADRHPEKEPDEKTKASNEAMMRMGKLGLESMQSHASRVLGYDIDLCSEDPAQEATFIVLEDTRSKLGELYRKVSTDLGDQREAWSAMRGSFDQLKQIEGKPLESNTLASLLTINGQVTDSTFTSAEVILSLAKDHSAWAKTELASTLVAANQGRSYDFKPPVYSAMVKSDHVVADAFKSGGLDVSASTEKLAGEVIFLVGREVSSNKAQVLRCEVFASGEAQAGSLQSLSKEALVALDNTVKLNEMTLTKLLKYTGEVIQVLDGITPAISKMDPTALNQTTLPAAVSTFVNGPREMLRYLSNYHTAIMLLAKESFQVLAAEPQAE